MTIAIDKDIPLPKTVERYGRYPFKQMQVGDSFFIEGGSEERIRLTSAASRHRIRFGGLFAVRKVDGGVRCWRVE